MKNITADKARNNTNKNFKTVKQFFTKRIKEISKNGYSSGTFNPKEYEQHLEGLIEWLKGLGFVCNKENDDCIRIVW